jgi:hypothetical protein
MTGMAPLLFFGLGIAAVALFHAGIYFPIGVSVFMFIAVSLFLIHRYRTKRAGLIILLLWLVYALPFIHIPSYLWFDFATEDPLILWGLAVNPYMTDERVITLTAMLGAVGALGMAFGSSLSPSRIKREYGLNPDGTRRAFRTMAFSIWLTWLIIGIALSWLAAPQDYLFAARYTASQSALHGANFGSAWMMSYVVLSFAFCDTLLEAKPIVKKLKWILVLAAIAFVVIFLQLLRGDRAAIPWVFALALVYFYWAVGFTQRRGFNIRWFKVVLWGGALVVVGMFMGAMRHSLVGIENITDVLSLIGDLAASGQIGFSNLLHGTWSAVLLTPLSVAGDYVNDLLVFKYGRDYLDLLLSTPPGFVADAAGYARPINALQGPAWEMRYGKGGTHATVLPFMNFGMAGVFLVPALWSYIMVRYEKFATQKVSAINLSFLATIALASAHWLWYGEKNMLNALILWLVIGFLYRISISILRKSPVDSNSCVPTQD